MTDRAPLKLAAIERLAAEYATLNEALSLENSLLAAEINALIRDRMPVIRSRIEATVAARDALRTAVASAPQLFEKPRTRVLNGVKVGFQRLKSVLAIKDEAPVIAKIHALMPELVSQLIRTSEALRRQALEALPAGDLKRLGVGLVMGSDVVVTKPQAADAVKTAEAVLKSWVEATDAADD
jgi:hypothetical protein